MGARAKANLFRESVISQYYFPPQGPLLSTSQYSGPCGGRWMIIICYESMIITGEWYGLQPYI